jgi:hypothetical protein
MSDIETPFDLCERHPDCLFQGGCECKRQAMRDRAIEPPFNCPDVPDRFGVVFPDGAWFDCTGHAVRIVTKLAAL